VELTARPRSGISADERAVVVAGLGVCAVVEEVIKTSVANPIESEAKKMGVVRRRLGFIGFRSMVCNH